MIFGMKKLEFMDLLLKLSDKDLEILEQYMKKLLAEDTATQTA